MSKNKRFYWTDLNMNCLKQEYEKLAKQQKPLFPALANMFNLSEDSIRWQLRKLRQLGWIKHYTEYTKPKDKILNEEPIVQSITDGVEQDGIYYVDAKGPEIKTLQQLLDQGGDDLNLFDVTRYIRNRWPTTMKDQNGNPIQIYNWQVKAWFGLKNTREALESIRDSIIKQIKIYADQQPRSYTSKKSSRKSGQTNLLEIALFDLHLGNLVWNEESGEDWDLSIAEKIFKSAINDLLSRINIKDIDRILYPVGNDFFHADTKQSTTTKGTPLNMDSRWQKMFTRGIELQRWAIDQMRNVAPVDVVVIPGNHDELSSICLGAVLDAIYEKVQDVNVDNSPRLRKYYRYGNTIIGFTHGNNEKIASLPMALAKEADKYLNEPAFSDTLFREFHIGHFHHSRGKRFIASYADHEGIFVRVLPTLTASDDWHAKRGMIFATKAAEAFVFDKKFGLTTILTSRRI